ncbi:beta-alanine-activating enzyme [Chelonus insularis]|uniref:beta-alanine-activating enzyme n=1 Tax=Chelonus insularis TaxID=460826 RepID=UPI00158B7A71|nr:beta-alanine-activating enzyme [Chelonus insularis]
MTHRIKKKNDLSKICNWSNLLNVAIEHYSETNETQNTSVSQELTTFKCTTINYLKIYRAQKALKSIILQNVKSSTQQFIGIHYSVPIYCIPSLILGIISAGHAFVYLSEDQLPFLVNSLEIKYLFIPKSASTVIKDVEVIKKFWMHKESLIFSKITCNKNDDDDDDETSDFKYNKLKRKNYLAYAITTSGSTGAAVPVKVSHASLLSNILDFRELFKLSSTDKITQLTPLTFDPSLIEIFLSLSSGATIVTVSEHLKNNPSKLLDILYNRKITFISTTPSLFLHRGWSLNDLKVTLFGKNSNLRILLLGGEIFPKLDLIFNIKDPENRTKIFNVYGITEVSCWASIQEIFCNQESNSDEQQVQLKLGTVLSDTIFQVRDIENDNHVIDEGEGILYIGSHTRICIIGNEELDDLKPPVFRKTGDLVKINKLGEIIFKGRQDTCIKRFGHKVYLNDLNYHAQKLYYIKDSYSFVFPPSNKLYLFLTISNEFINHHTDIIQDVWVHIKLLPAIMYPDKIHILNHFEMTERGKICKDYLMNICTDIEKTSNISNINSLDIKGLLQESWMNHLHCHVNNINLTRFIDVGGTSVIALQILSELTDKSQRSFPNLVGMLLENKTLEECLDYIDKCNGDVEFNISECDIKKNNHKSIPNINNYSNNVYIWQKYRGRTKIISLNDNHPHQSMQNVIHESIIFDVDKYQTFNLRKCVDASPTVFGYSFSSEGLLQNTDEESAFVCVGSHLGIICTVELNANHSEKYKKWEIQLPQSDNTIPRIEASILVLDNFRGVVGCHNGNIYCIHLKTGEIYWTFATNDIVKCSAEICSKKENIFIGSYDHFFYCISTQDGSLVWRRKIYSSICSTPLVHDETGNVIIGLLNGMCICLDQTSGDLQWEYRLENPIFSSPIALDDNVVVVADVCGNLTGLKIITNNHHQMAQNYSNRLWNFNISGQIFSDLVVFTDSSTPNLQNLIFASKNGFLYRYYLDNPNSVPKLKYRIDCGYMIVSTPWVNESIILIGREDGILKVIDYQIGCFLHSFNLHGNCFSSPVLYKNFITVGCRDDNLYVLCLQREKDKKE